MRVVHARVLPVEQPQAPAVVEEVRGQQVVVAGHVRPVHHGFDRVGGGPQLGVGSRDRAAALARGALVAGGQFERREAPSAAAGRRGSRAASRRPPGTTAAQLVGRHRAALDEGRDQARLGRPLTSGPMPSRAAATRRGAARCRGRCRAARCPFPAGAPRSRGRRSARGRSSSSGPRRAARLPTRRGRAWSPARAGHARSLAAQACRKPPGAVSFPMRCRLPPLPLRRSSSPCRRRRHSRRRSSASARRSGSGCSARARGCLPSATSPTSSGSRARRCARR